MSGSEIVAEVLIYLVIMFILAKAATKLDAVHFPYKLFLLWLAVGLIVPLSNLGIKIAVADSLSAEIQQMTQTLYQTSIYILIVVSAYFFIYLLSNLFFKAAVQKQNPLRVEGEE